MRWSPGEIRVGGIVCTVLFGGVGLGGMLLARGPAPIELLPSGLRWQMGTAPSHVGCDDVMGVPVFAIRNAWFLGFDVRRGGLRMPPRRRWLTHVNRRIAHTDASIALEAFPVEPERLAEVVAACAGDADRRSEIATEESVAWLTSDEAISAEETPEPAASAPPALR